MPTDHQVISGTRVNNLKGVGFAVASLVTGFEFPGDAGAHEIDQKLRSFLPGAFRLIDEQIDSDGEAQLKWLLLTKDQRRVSVVQNLEFPTIADFKHHTEGNQKQKFPNNCLYLGKLVLCPFQNGIDLNEYLVTREEVMTPSLMSQEPTSMTFSFFVN
jgi:hypothetical protein